MHSSVLSFKMHGIKNFIQVISFSSDQLLQPATVIFKSHCTHLCYGHLQWVSWLFISSSPWGSILLRLSSLVLINQNKFLRELDILLSSIFTKLAIHDFTIKIYILVKFSTWLMNNGGTVKGPNNIRSVFVYWLGCLCLTYVSRQDNSSGLYALGNGIQHVVTKKWHYVLALVSDSTQHIWLII